MGEDKFPFYHPSYTPPTRDLKKVKENFTKYYQKITSKKK